MKALFAALCLTRLGLAAANFACVCNYKQTVTVYSKETTLSAPLGNIGGWGCNQILSMSVADQWYPVAFQHQVGYVKEDPQVLMQMCVGDPPTDHKITPAPAITTTPTVTTTTSTTTPTTTTTSTTTPTTTTTSTSTPTTTTTSTTTPTTTTTTPPTTTNPPTTTGNVDLCPGSISRVQSIFHAAVGQCGHKCYTLSLNKTCTWSHADQICRDLGATLLQIANSAEQAFVTDFVSRSIGKLPVWLGRRHNYEGKRDHNSGHGDGHGDGDYHHDNTAVTTPTSCYVLTPGGGVSHVACGVFVPLLNIDLGEMHNVMCQYDIQNTNALFG